MCGIAGIVNQNKESVNRELIHAMTELVAHRGPDDHDHFFEKNIALGHRRLSILDLSSMGKQPMQFADRFVITYNGEIYNYIEIREELLSLGYKFITNTDTEVILSAYHCWGKDAVHKFNGMWAFAIYDRELSAIFCSRDRFGVKPFYYCSTEKFILFGSEIKQLLAITCKAKVNQRILINYLVAGLEEYNNQTFFEGILKLNPGHNLTININTGEIKEEKYYYLKAGSSYSTLHKNESEFLYEKELTRSINYRLRSDVKVGTCLSGGIDSSLIASYAAPIYTGQTSQKFSAFTAQSLDSKNDETAFAREVVDKGGLDWHCVMPSTDNFKNELDKIVNTQEEPFGSPSIAMQFFVMKMASLAKCPVLLDGQGGDETMLGYERYFPAYINSLPVTQKLNAILKISENSKLKFKDVILFQLYFRISSIRYRKIMNDYNFIKPEFLDLLDRNLLSEIAHSYNDIKSMQILELTKTQLPHLLKYEDKNSMHFSIETRLPLLDYKLVELCLSLPPDAKIKNGWTKYTMRKLLEKKVSADIAWRKHKIGFEAPSEQWLKDAVEMEKAILESPILNKLIKGSITEQLKDKRKFWKLFNIAAWEKKYNVSVD